MRLEGRCLGLERAVAEVEDERRRAERSLALVPASQTVRSVTSRLVGWVGGLLGALLLFGGGCVVLGLLVGECSATISDDYEAVIETSSHVGLTPGTRCVVAIEQEDEADPCASLLRCGTRVVYRGVGTCADHRGTSDYWEERPADPAVAPSLVLSERNEVAILRGPQGLVVLALHP